MEKLLDCIRFRISQFHGSFQDEISPQNNTTVQAGGAETFYYNPNNVLVFS